MIGGIRRLDDVDLSRASCFIVSVRDADPDVIDSSITLAKLSGLGISYLKNAVVVQVPVIGKVIFIAGDVIREGR